MRFCTCLVVSASLLLASCGDDRLVAQKSHIARITDVPDHLAAAGAADPSASTDLAGGGDEPAGGAECLTDDGAPYVAPSC